MTPETLAGRAPGVPRALHQALQRVRRRTARRELAARVVRGERSRVLQLGPLTVPTPAQSEWLREAPGGPWSAAPLTELPHADDAVTQVLAWALLDVDDATAGRRLDEALRVAQAQVLLVEPLAWGRLSGRRGWAELVDLVQARADLLYAGLAVGLLSRQAVLVLRPLGD
jgi:hypothetical protein